MSSTILWGLAALAILLVLIAGFNFVNLSTALAIKRSKEVGIKKVIGSYTFATHATVYAGSPGDYFNSLFYVIDFY